MIGQGWPWDFVFCSSLVGALAADSRVFYGEALLAAHSETCAAICAMGVGLGAIAVGGTASVTAVWRPIAAVAGLIWHREIVMDIKDTEGDGMAGVRTLPVAYGARTALHLSLVPLLSAAAAVGLATPLAALPLLVQAGWALRARSKAFSDDALSPAIELAPAWLLATLIVLTR